MGKSRFLRCSLQSLSEQLGLLGHDLCPSTIGRLLRQQGYALRVNIKRFTGPPHPDRDRQFHVLQEQVDYFRRCGLPILSIDAKKKELIGNYANGGVRWSLHGEEVNCHDFREAGVVRAAPYGMYDVGLDRGYVCVGTSADTSAFAVDAVKQWWIRFGCKHYRGAQELLLLADAGGSNGYRRRLWKKCLQDELADRYHLRVTVCHYPSGASKWNPVEHRLFGPISVNWSGVPLRTLATLVGYVRGTKTAGGAVEAWLNAKTYATGLRVTDQQMEKINLWHPHPIPAWNYEIRPRFDPIWN